MGRVYAETVKVLSDSFPFAYLLHPDVKDNLMNAMLQKTHILPSFGILHFVRIIAARKQGAQGHETADVLPKDLNCNVRDETIEEEDGPGKCLARPRIEHYVLCHRGLGRPPRLTQRHIRECGSR